MTTSPPPARRPFLRRGLVFGFPGPTVGANANGLPVRPVPVSLATRKRRSGLGWRDFLALRGARHPHRPGPRFRLVWI